VPPQVSLVRVETAREMLAACQAALPVDVAICAAAVADWRVAEAAPQKLKKGAGRAPTLQLVENPDILASLSQAGPSRPLLVVGFAAETEHLVEHATAKRRRKGCDWILANDVSPETGTFGGDDNRLILVTGDAVETWEAASKLRLAEQLAARIAAALG
jgi:phosphopantothenoylcysteine decarboxylase/phosphopantothenate--cysteine ligase